MPVNIEDKACLKNYLILKGYMKHSYSFDWQIVRGGVSNKTVKIKFNNRQSWFLKQGLHKLRVEEDWFSDPSRTVKEALGLQWLSKICPEGTIPKFIFVDPEENILCMATISDKHQNFKKLLLAGEIHQQHFRQFGKVLGQIHLEGINRAPQLKKLFADRYFFETLRLEPYYSFTAAKFPAQTYFFENLRSDCLNDVYTLVHGDFSPKNILVFRDKFILLDHEVIHFGDGTFDIGFAMCHILSKANHMEKLRTEFIMAAQNFWQAYLDNCGHLSISRQRRAVQHTLACLLARIHGRSPLEYLTAGQQELQSKIVKNLLEKKIPVMDQLIQEFHNELKNA